MRYGYPRSIGSACARCWSFWAHAADRFRTCRLSDQAIARTIPAAERPWLATSSVASRVRGSSTPAPRSAPLRARPRAPAGSRHGPLRRRGAAASWPPAHRRARIEGDCVVIGADVLAVAAKTSAAVLNPAAQARGTDGRTERYRRSRRQALLVACMAARFSTAAQIARYRRSRLEVLTVAQRGTDGRDLGYRRSRSYQPECALC